MEPTLPKFGRTVAWCTAVASTLAAVVFGSRDPWFGAFCAGTAGFIVMFTSTPARAIDTPDSRMATGDQSGLSRIVSLRSLATVAFGVMMMAGLITSTMAR